MSDLTANNCGCAASNNSCGNSCSSCNIIWIILLLSVFGNNGDCGCGNGILGNNNGCGNGILGGNSCDWLIWILLLSCFCGNNNSCC